MGLFDWHECKETRKDSKGREYTYNLTTKKVTRKQRTHTDSLGYADNSAQAFQKANADKEPYPH